MKHRFKTSKSKSRRNFKKTVGRVHAMNFKKPLARMGTRL